ncbi:hypothetical protein SDC9_185737 [bioreactor metagenome]|uniref:Uncharacterized protein n=1 Tax=bioreactor metagenome TaxID=1076179 RepID=A0A645HS54_9ZZZZ
MQGLIEFDVIAGNGASFREHRRVRGFPVAGRHGFGFQIGTPQLVAARSDAKGDGIADPHLVLVFRDFPAGHVHRQNI